MSKFGEIELIKKPHQKLLLSDEQLFEFLQCADPEFGPFYFLTHFFYIQHPTKGKLLYEPYEYQIRLLDSYHNNRRCVAMLPRQAGKSVTAAGYLLWFAMFISDQTILVSANKFTSAGEIMSRIRFAYESVPDYIRAGITEYNKHSITFDNGSRIAAQTTTETTGRGMSISLLYCLGGKNNVTVKDKITGEIKNISLKDLYMELNGE